MDFLNRFIDFFQKYQFLISIVGTSILFITALFISSEYDMIRIPLGFFGVVIAGLDFSKVSKESEARNRQIIKVVLRSILMAAGMFIIFWAIPSFLWAYAFHK